MNYHFRKSNNFGALAVACFVVFFMFSYSIPVYADEGWCGGTDTKKCCEEQGNKGSCSCVCIPGNCYCGPRLTAPGGTNSIEPDEKLKVLELKSGKIVSKKNVKNKDLPRKATAVSVKTVETKSAYGVSTKVATPLTPKGKCCAKVHTTCISCCYKKEGCTGKGDCKLCSPNR